MTEILSGNLYVGLSGIKLASENLIFSRSIRLETTFAHVMSPITIAFSPPTERGYHPPPWKAARGGFGQDITAQLVIPETAGMNLNARLEIASTIVFLLRLWSDPSVTMPALSNISFSDIAGADDGVAHIVPIEHRPRTFQLLLSDDSKITNSLNWVTEHFETALTLRAESSEFRLAAYALGSGQFVENTALVLISLWGALEAIFSPSTSELRFRVSSLIAAYLYSAGTERLKKQKEIAALYDKRSAAAHGKSKHAGDDLLATFELLRKVLIKIIRDGAVPTKQDLEERLFGG